MAASLDIQTQHNLSSGWQELCPEPWWLSSSLCMLDQYSWLWALQQVDQFRLDPFLIPTHFHRRSRGGLGGLGPLLEKLVSLAWQKWELGMTKMRAWQDRNGSLAGQKWELSRTEMRAWQKIICKTPHFPRFSVIFVCFLPLLVGFYHIFQFFFNFWLFCSHSPAMFAHWQNSLAE